MHRYNGFLVQFMTCAINNALQEPIFYSCVPNWWELGFVSIWKNWKHYQNTRMQWHIQHNWVPNVFWNALVVWVEEAVRMSIHRSEIICFEKWHRYWKPKSTTATIGGSTGLLRLTLDGIETIPITNQIKQIHWF